MNATDKAAELQAQIRDGLFNPPHLRRDPAQAGWNYASRGICPDPIHRDVSYPWHDEKVRPTDHGRGESDGYCARCGEKRPD